MRDINVDDYVFVSRWSDEDPNDPWYVGFISEVGEDSRGKFFRVHDQARYWRNCRKITKEEGDTILATFPDLEIIKIKK